MNWFRRSKPDDPTPEPTARPAPSAPPPDPIVIDEVTPQAVHEALAAGESLTFLDVRQSWDHELQHPAGAEPCPLNELPYRLDEFDPSARIVLSCYHGNTSKQGVAFLMERGFSNVQSMAGGFAGWAEAQLPIEGRAAPQSPA